MEAAVAQPVPRTPALRAAPIASGSRHSSKRHSSSRHARRTGTPRNSRRTCKAAGTVKPTPIRLGTSRPISRPVSSVATPRTRSRRTVPTSRRPWRPISAAAWVSARRALPIQLAPIRARALLLQPLRVPACPATQRRIRRTARVRRLSQARRCVAIPTCFARRPHCLPGSQFRLLA